MLGVDCLLLLRFDLACLLAALILAIVSSFFFASATSSSNSFLLEAAMLYCLSTNIMDCACGAFAAQVVILRIRSSVEDVQIGKI